MNASPESTVNFTQLIDLMVAQYREAITPVVSRQVTTMSEELIETKDISDKIFLIKPQMMDVTVGGEAVTQAAILTAKRVNVAHCYILYYERKDVYDAKMRAPFILRYFTISPTRNMVEQVRIELPDFYEAEVQRQLRVLFADTIASVKRSGMLYLSILPIEAQSVVEAKLHLEKLEKDGHV